MYQRHGTVPVKQTESDLYRIWFVGWKESRSIKSIKQERKQNLHENRRIKWENITYSIFWKNGMPPTSALFEYWYFVLSLRCSNRIIQTYNLFGIVYTFDSTWYWVTCETPYTISEIARTYKTKLSSSAKCLNYGLELYDFAPKWFYLSLQ